MDNSELQEDAFHRRSPMKKAVRCVQLFLEQICYAALAVQTSGIRDVIAPGDDGACSGTVLLSTVVRIRVVVQRAGTAATTTVGQRASCLRAQITGENVKR